MAPRTPVELLDGLPQPPTWQDAVFNAPPVKADDPTPNNA